MEKVFDNNKVSICGEIASGFTYSHDVFGEGFYLFDLKVNRLSDTEDIIPVMVSERIIDVQEDYVGKIARISGQFRSYNRHDSGRSRLDVAVRFGKEHSKVIRSIEQMRENSSSQNWLKCFKLSTYQDLSGKSNKMYFMNRDGFSLLVMGFNGKKAMDWKWKYIEAFNTMEKLLRERSTEVWLETRKQGKLTRRSETDVIKNLVEYAKEQEVRILTNCI